MARWYVRQGGSTLNAGSDNNDSAKVTRDSTGGTLVANVLTDAGADYSTIVDNVDCVNMIIGGVEVVRRITAHDDGAKTLTLTGGAGTETYTGYRVGGARSQIKKAVSTNAGNTVPMAQGDITLVDPSSSYVETSIAINVSNLSVRSGTPGTRIVIYGTGGGANTDVILAGSGTSRYTDLEVINAVRNGYTNGGNNGYVAVNCLAHGCGNAGFHLSAAGGTITQFWYCSAYNNAIGYSQAVSNSTLRFFYSESRENTGDGVHGGNGGNFCGLDTMIHFLCYDNGGDGMEFSIGTANPAVATIVAQCTFDGNAGSNAKFTGAFQTFGYGSLFQNNILSNAGAYGVTMAADLDSDRVRVSGNIYYNNPSGDRNNFPAGTDESTSDPLFVDAGGDNYTPASGSPAIGAGFTAYKSPNKLNIGAVVHGSGGGGVPVIGGAIVRGA